MTGPQRLQCEAQQEQAVQLAGVHAGAWEEGPVCGGYSMNAFSPQTPFPKAPLGGRWIQTAEAAGVGRAGRLFYFEKETVM